MLNREDLESLIRRYVILGKRSPKGFEAVKCAKCNDYKARGGFKFENGSVAYNCFNCSTKTGYDPSKSTMLNTMKEVILAFGIPEDELNACIFFKQPQESIPGEAPRPKVDLPTTAIPLPNGAIPITDDSSEWSSAAREYLRGRGLSHTEYPYLVTDETAYVGRVIIPYYFREKVIYWQARSLADEYIQPRYKNPVVEKDNIFFNMDEVFRYTNEPLFVVEGPLDALSIGKNAVALTGSTLSEFRFRELQKVASRRKVIFVIDKNLNGYKLGQQVLKDESIDWHVACFPDNYEDANDALQKLGRLWIISHLASTAVRGIQGKLLLELHCSKK